VVKREEVKREEVKREPNQRRQLNQRLRQTKLSLRMGPTPVNNFQPPKLRR
jgi:hypothetical protein